MVLIIAEVLDLQGPTFLKQPLLQFGLLDAEQVLGGRRVYSYIRSGLIALIFLPFLISRFHWLFNKLCHIGT